MPSPFRLPFTWKTPIGYAIYVTVESLSSIAIGFSILPSACLGIGSYLLVCAVIEVIANEYHVLCGKATINNGQDMKKLFCSMVGDIADIKQLSN